MKSLVLAILLPFVIATLMGWLEAIVRLRRHAISLTMKICVDPELTRAHIFSSWISTCSYIVFPMRMPVKACRDISTSLSEEL